MRRPRAYSGATWAMEPAMTKSKHWHWGLMFGVFVVAYLLMPRSAAAWASLLPP